MSQFEGYFLSMTKQKTSIILEFKKGVYEYGWELSTLSWGELTMSYDDMS